MRPWLALAIWLLATAPAWAGCRVALDIGHSRQVFGATSARGVTEWEFNAALARRVAAALDGAGIDRLPLDDSGAAVALEERSRRAAAAGASLLISLHHDDVQDRYKSDWSWQGRTLSHGEAFSGFGLFVSARNPAFAESRLVAEAIADGLLAAGLHPSLHHAEAIAGEGRPLLDSARGLYRFDDLVVLRSAAIPAVLVEAGIIVNRDDEPEIASDAYRDRVAAAIVAAARDHCRRLAGGVGYRP